MRRGLRNRIKRAIDVLGAAAALLAFLPVMALAAVAVRLTMGRPVLYRQTRPGLHGRPFEMMKFRTMRELHDDLGRPLPDADRLTKVGRFLRSTSIDELPELINVIRGEMSLVGPRPLLMEYLPEYTPEQARRHDVLPGITGLAQVTGRNVIPWDEKLSLDVQYVDRQGLWLDCRILLTTIWKVLRREGISAHAHATAPKFTGAGRQ